MLLSTCAYLFNVMNISETLRKEKVIVIIEKIVTSLLMLQLHERFIHSMTFRNLFAFFSTYFYIISDITATTEIKFIPFVTSLLTLEIEDIFCSRHF